MMKLAAASWALLGLVIVGLAAPLALPLLGLFLPSVVGRTRARIATACRRRAFAIDEAAYHARFVAQVRRG